MLKENLKNVQNNIKKACERVGRKPEEVTLVAVSKMKPLSDIEELLETGQLEYGENYVQELCDKYENISKPVHWHMIGHLQTNKVKYIIDKVELIHSVDSLHLAKQIEKEAVKKRCGRTDTCTGKYRAGRYEVWYRRSRGDESCRRN